MHQMLGLWVDIFRGKMKKEITLQGLACCCPHYFLCSWFLVFPLAYLCLDTVHVGCEGEVLFLKPKNIGRFFFFFFCCCSFVHSFVIVPLQVCEATAPGGFFGFNNWCSVFSAGSRDEFYLAPEYQEHGIVTEKVCQLNALIYFRNVLSLDVCFGCSLIHHSSLLSCIASGLCVRGCCYSLGYGQVQFIT